MYIPSELELLAGSIVYYSYEVCELSNAQKFHEIEDIVKTARKKIGIDAHKTRKQNRAFYILMHNLLCAIMDTHKCGFEQAVLIICTATDADISTIYGALRRYYNKRRWFDADNI